jgi:hypothetical protein
MQNQDWRDLCWEAMHEKDVNKLLLIFLELDRATERKQLKWKYLPRQCASTDKSNRKKIG